MESFSTADYSAASALEKETMGNYLNYLKAADVYNELLFRKKKEGYVQELEKLPDLSQFKPESTDTNTPKRTLYYQRMAHAIRLCLVQDTQAQYEITKLIVKDAAVIIETNECLSAYFEHLTSCICVGAFSELIDTLTKLKDDVKKGIFGTDQNLKIKLFYYSANYELMAYTYMGDKNNLLLKIKEVEFGIEKQKDILSTEMKLVMYSALKMAHYFTGNTETAKSYISKIAEFGVAKVRLDIYQDSLLFSLLICTDLNSVKSMEEVLNKIKNYWDLNSPQYKFEKMLYTIFLDYAMDLLSKETLYDKIIAAYTASTPIIENGLHYTENYFAYFLWASGNKQKTPVLELASKLHK